VFYRRREGEQNTAEPIEKELDYKAVGIASLILVIIMAAAFVAFRIGFTDADLTCGILLVYQGKFNYGYDERQRNTSCTNTMPQV
jgi:hypothetical protein